MVRTGENTYKWGKTGKKIGHKGARDVQKRVKTGKRGKKRVKMGRNG